MNVKLWTSSSPSLRFSSIQVKNEPSSQVQERQVPLHFASSLLKFLLTSLLRFSSLLRLLWWTIELAGGFPRGCEMKIFATICIVCAVFFCFFLWSHVFYDTTIWHTYFLFQIFVYLFVIFSTICHTNFKIHAVFSVFAIFFCGHTLPVVFPVVYFCVSQWCSVVYLSLFFLWFIFCVSQWCFSVVFLSGILFLCFVCGLRLWFQIHSQKCGFR